MAAVRFERLSIELSNRCSKACWFCYSSSTPSGEGHWTVADLGALLEDCAAHGTQAVSFGGGEPLEEPALLYPVLERLRGRLFRSFTTNGQGLDRAWSDVVAAAPDKVHVSIHFPGSRAEVARVVDQVGRLARVGIRSGVNLLVMRGHLDDAASAVRVLHASGIDNRRIVYLPMRGPNADTPSASELVRVAGGPFQSMTCLERCAPSPRFVAIGWDRTVAHCSYTTARRRLAAPTHRALTEATVDLGLTFCGDAHDGLVRLSRRPLDGHDVVRR